MGKEKGLLQEGRQEGQHWKISFLPLFPTFFFFLSSYPYPPTPKRPLFDLVFLGPESTSPFPIRRRLIEKKKKVSKGGIFISRGVVGRKKRKREREREKKQFKLWEERCFKENSAKKNFFGRTFRQGFLPLIWMVFLSSHFRDIDFLKKKNVTSFFYHKGGGGETNRHLS